MFYIALVSCFERPVISILVRWKTESNENKERGLILSLNNYSWALQEGTLTTLGVLSDGIIKRLSQPVVHCTTTFEDAQFFLWSLLESVKKFMGEIKAGVRLSRCDVIVQFHIVALKIWGFFHGVVNSLARAWEFEDSNKTRMLFFF